MVTAFLCNFLLLTITYHLKTTPSGWFFAMHIHKGGRQCAVFYGLNTGLNIKKDMDINVFGVAKAKESV